MPMHEPKYLLLADATFKRLERAFEDADPDVCDCERAGDVVTLTFKGGKRCIVNTQRPTQQIWLAASARGWHFSFDANTDAWLDDKGTGDELFATLARVVKESCGLDVHFA